MKTEIKITLKAEEVSYICRALMLLSSNSSIPERQRHVYLNKVEELLTKLRT